MAAKVLLVDSIAYNRKQFAHILTVNNYSVKETTNTTDALLKLQFYHPDIILIGSALIQQTNSDLDTILNLGKEKTHIIVHNLYRDEEGEHYEAQLRRRGVSGFVYSPINAQDLLNVIQLDFSDTDHDTPNPSSRTITPAMIEAFTVKTVHDISKTLDSDIIQGKLVKMEAAFTTMGVAAVIDYYYKKQNGSIMIDMTPETALFIAGKILNTIPDTITDDVKKAIKSLTKSFTAESVRKLTDAQDEDNVVVSVPKIYTANIMKEVQQNQEIYMCPLGIDGSIINLSFFIQSIE